MPSSYTGFTIRRDNNDGTFPAVPNQPVQVYDVTHGAALADTASDGFGNVPGATVAVDAGTLLRFSVARADGLNGCAETETI